MELNEPMMRILALEPYYDGSHRQFLDGWSARSGHEFTILSLPAHKWKWRMRHASVTFADRVAELSRSGRRFDAIFCSDMLNLPEFLGLAPPCVRTLPAIAYFHENQLTYPDDRKDQRDVHFGLSNMVTALASQAWFNSEYHRDEFLGALGKLLGSMPDYQLPDAVGRIRDTSRIMHPGVDEFPPRGPRPDGPLRILWAARWEHDKDPETFFDAVGRLQAAGVNFRLSVIGQQFKQIPPVFETARKQFSEHIDRWGYQETLDDYRAALREADVFVSTARHEFFGISAVEAAAAGAMPILPKRLAYPEVFQLDKTLGAEALFYSGGAEGLAARLAQLAETTENLWPGATEIVKPLTWSRIAAQMDDCMQQL
jgi:glycosyltransferase involved in cell wall biosynthesis